MHEGWPAIPYGNWAPTYEALHRFSQILGKYRLAHTPWINHSWHATLYVTPRGLTTGVIPDGERAIRLDFDLFDEVLVASCATGRRERFPLKAMSVAQFLECARTAVEALGGRFDIHGRPSELPDNTPFVEDRERRPWDGEAVLRFHRALLSIERVLQRFRTGFIGKASPVHLFWGALDLAVTRFSGRPAPLHPGGIPNLPDSVTREAYSHEVSSAGFWAGGSGVDEAMFYSYAYPTPRGFSEWPVEPQAAHWDVSLGEFLLPYEAVRKSDDPERTLMSFLQSTYDAAAATGDWDRAALDCPSGRPRVPRPLANEEHRR
jgi:hypothetical protein